MEFMSGLTDDQTALVGCVVALMVCGLAMTLSGFLGQAREGSRPQRTLSMVRHRSAAPATARSETDAGRKAA